jgi:NADH dehydrogenase FAD-containing subunit
MKTWIGITHLTFIGEERTTMETTFLLVGGGFGGVETAIQLRRLTQEASITLVTKEPFLVYKPWLVYLPAQHVSFEHCQIPLQPLAERFRFHLLVDAVSTLAPQQHQVHLASGKSISYAHALIATGSTADREIIAGTREFACSPCDVEEALLFGQRFLQLKKGTVTVIIGGQRPGPGLEYAGWIARYLRHHRLADAIRLRVIDSQPRLMGHLGERAAGKLEAMMNKPGVSLLTGQAVKAITALGVQMQDGHAYASDLTAVVGHLRGQELGVEQPVVDEKGFVPVNDFFQHPMFPDLFAIGDAAALKRAVPKSMLMARKLAPLVAQNLLAWARGRSEELISATRLRQGKIVALPDVGGETAMVLQGGKVVAGSWPLLLRTVVDYTYFFKRNKPGRRG